MRLRLGLAGMAAAAAAIALAPADAQRTSEVAAARRAGTVGERFDGYMGFAAQPSQAVRQQVGAINIRRRSLYTGLARRRGLTLQVVGIAAGCELLARVGVGEAYMLSDGVWRRRLPGQPPPRPEHCPG